MNAWAAAIREALVELSYSEDDSGHSKELKEI